MTPAQRKRIYNNLKKQGYSDKQISDIMFMLISILGIN